MNFIFVQYIIYDIKAAPILIYVMIPLDYVESVTQRYKSTENLNKIIVAVSLQLQTSSNEKTPGTRCLIATGRGSVLRDQNRTKRRVNIGIHDSTFLLISSLYQLLYGDAIANKHKNEPQCLSVDERPRWSDATPLFQLQIINKTTEHLIDWSDLTKVLKMTESPL